MAERPWYMLTFGQVIRKPTVLASWYGMLAAVAMFGWVTGIWAPWPVFVVYGLLPPIFGGASWLLERTVAPADVEAP